MEEITARNATLTEQRSTKEARLGDLETGCDTGIAAGLYYLHADHLGRPQMATDSSGIIMWDMGAEVTPFGDGVNLAGAFAQTLP